LAERKDYADRIERALEAYFDDLKKGGQPLIRAFARQYSLKSWTILRDRINRGRISRFLYAQKRQRLTPAKEDVLVEQCLRLERWGFPARIHQLRALAEELLRAKGDNMPLGINWPQAFLTRYTCLKSAFITP
jgi:hypothetical protein